MLCLVHSSSTKVRQVIGTRATFRKISSHYNGNSDIKITSNKSSKLLLNDLVGRNLVQKRTRKANIKHQSDHEKLKMRNWTNAASWIKQGKNPYEALESKVPDPPRVGEQGPEDFLVASGEVGCTRNIAIHMPQSYNPLNKNVVGRIDALLRKYESGRMVNTASISGYDGNFCTGLDFGYIFSHRDLPEGKAYLKQAYQMAYTLATMQTPVVSFLDGISLGAGNALFLHAPVRFATDRGLIAFRDIEVGWFPDAGVSHVLANIPNGLGMYLALSGHAIEGADVYWAGLANYWCLSSAVSTVKSGIGRCYSPDISRVVAAIEGAKHNPNTNNNFFSEYEANIAKCFSKDTLKGVIEALEKDGGGWAQKTLQHIRKSNPVSVLVTFNLIKMAEKMTLEESMRTEYYCAQQFLKSRDLFEGIERLVLRDPAEEPVWQYKSIEEVPQHVIDEYFSDKGKEKLELTRMSDVPPHKKVDELAELHQNFEVEKMPKEEFDWRSRVDSTLLEVVLPYFEKMSEEIQRIQKQELIPAVRHIMDEIYLHAQALLVKRASFDPVGEIKEYLITSMSPEESQTKVLSSYKKFIDGTLRKAAFLQEKFKELQTAKDPTEQKRVDDLLEKAKNLSNVITEAIAYSKEQKIPITMLKPELDEYENILYQLKEEYFNEKEKAIYQLLKLEYLETVPEEEIYQRLRDRVFFSYFSKYECDALIKLFRDIMDNCLEKGGLLDREKSLRDYVKIWKLQIDQMVEEKKVISATAKQFLDEVPEGKQQQEALTHEYENFITESVSKFNLDLQSHVYEELAKIIPKIQSYNASNYSRFVESQKEYMQEVEKALPVVTTSFYEKNIGTIRDIFAQGRERLLKLDALVNRERVEAIKTPVPIVQVIQRANDLVKALNGYKGNINLADHTQALVFLRHSVNQEISFVTGAEKSNLYIIGKSTDFKDLETALQSLIQEVDRILNQKPRVNFPNTDFPIYYRIIHEYFAPELVSNPNSLNSLISQKINPLKTLKNTIENISSLRHSESIYLNILEFQQNEMEKLYQSLGVTWLLYRQKAAFGLREPRGYDPDVMARAFIDLNTGKINYQKYLEIEGLTKLLEHYKQSGFSDTELSRVKETLLAIQKYEADHLTINYPAKDIVVKYVAHQLDTEKMTLSKRSEMQKSLKELKEGKSVAEAAPVFNMKKEEIITEDEDFESEIKKTKRNFQLEELLREKLSYEAFEENAHVTFKARGFEYPKKPITNEELMTQVEKSEEFFDTDKVDNFSRKEELERLNRDFKIYAKADINRNFQRAKFEAEGQLEALSSVLGKIGKYYDPTAPDPAERLKAQVQQELNYSYEQAVDPKVKEDVDSLRSKLQEIRHNLEEAEIDAVKTASRFKLTEDELNEMIRELNEDPAFVDPERSRHPKDPVEKFGDHIGGMSFEEMADAEFEFESIQKEKLRGILREEDMV